MKSSKNKLDLANNKKVLLCEHKRHTAHHVAIASAYYSRGGTWIWGTPQRWGTPHPRLGYSPSKVGVPPHPRLGTPSSKVGVHPPIQGWIGYPPIQGWIRYPLIQGWIGYPTPPPIQGGIGTPPSKAGLGTPPPESEQTFPSINITFPRTTYTGGKILYLDLDSDKFDLDLIKNYQTENNMDMNVMINNITIWTLNQLPLKRHWIKAF